jgi:hypothetical protein
VSDWMCFSVGGVWVARIVGRIVCGVRAAVCVH